MCHMATPPVDLRHSVSIAQRIGHSAVLVPALPAELTPKTNQCLCRSLLRPKSAALGAPSWVEGVTG
jgi:hypothetical protein